MKQYTLIFICLIFVNSLIAQQTKPQIALTTISFEETKFNFGEIEEGERIQNVFRFTNTGDNPLLITNAKGSCGCTVPEWPRAPLMPGESSYLIVEFNSRNKKGKQTKRVTITSNTEPAQSFLMIVGDIINVKDEEVISKSEKLDSKSTIPFNLDGVNGVANISLYPNPTTDQVTISFADHISRSAQIDIYNSLGEKLLSRKVDKLTKETKLDLPNFEGGTYTASIKVSGMHRIAKQFVVIDH